MSDNQATVYAKQIARSFWDADKGAPFGYRDESDTEADTLTEVLDTADIPEDERDEYDTDNLPDGWRIASGMDYVSDALDFEYVVSSDRSYKHANVCIGLGGPNVWISTEDATVTVYWGDRSTQAIPRAVAEALDDALGELWDMG
jgi:hypothetical protein